VKWPRNASHVGEKRYDLVVKLKERAHWKNLGIDGRIIVK
jgi:hypothetical protein